VRGHAEDASERRERTPQPPALDSNCMELHGTDRVNGDSYNNNNNNNNQSIPLMTTVPSEELGICICMAEDLYWTGAGLDNACTGRNLDWTMLQHWSNSVCSANYSFVSSGAESSGKH
jgi:hypothetical protein